MSPILYWLICLYTAFIFLTFYENLESMCGFFFLFNSIFEKQILAETYFESLYFIKSNHIITIDVYLLI